MRDGRESIAADQRDEFGFPFSLRYALFHKHRISFSEISRIRLKWSLHLKG